MKTAYTIALCVLMGCALTAPLVAPHCAEPMTMSPHKIILNAQGQSEDFQAVINMRLASGYTLGDYDVTLSLADQEVIQAQSFRYCYIDDNFLAGFNRDEVLDSPVVHSLAGQTVQARVAGSYVGVAADGTTRTFTFEAFDMVEIIAPGKNMK